MIKYMTPRGIARMRTKIQKLEEKLASLESQVGTVTSQGGETWHDNAPYEILCHEIRTTNQILSGLHENLGDIELVGYPQFVDTVCIGSEVEVKRDGKIEVYRILGYEESNINAEPIEVSYQAPIAQSFFGKRKGEKVVFKGQVFDIIDIRPINPRDLSL